MPAYGLLSGDHRRHKIGVRGSGGTPPGSYPTPTFPLPFAGALTSICLDVWVSADYAPGQTNALSVAPEIYNTSTTPGTGTRYPLSPLTYSGYTQTKQVVRLTGRITPSGTPTIAAGSVLMFGIRPDVVDAPAPTLHYDSQAHYSSITVNQPSCPPPPAPGPPAASPTAAPPSPSATATADPTTSPSAEPTGSPSCPPTSEPTEEPTAEPTGSDTPTPTRSAASPPGPLPSVPAPLPTLSQLPSAAATYLYTSSPSPSRTAGSAAATGEPTSDPSGDPSNAPSPNRDCGGSGSGGSLPADVSYTGATAGRYADTVTLSARVTDPTGQPIPGGTVTFTAGRLTLTANVTADGTATTTAKLVDDPGYYKLVATYSGTGQWKAGSRESVIHVTPTNCALHLARRVISSGTQLDATITQPDTTGIGGARVGYTYNGRSLGTATTATSGLATLRTPEKGTRGGSFTASWNGDTRHTGCSAAVRL